MSKHEFEQRLTEHGLTVEERGEGDVKSSVLVGYAAVFNKMSNQLGGPYGFREQIEPGAFDGVMDNDVRAVINHDANYVLGRSSAGTLRLSIDDVGLRYEIDMPNTSFARDLMESVRRGDIKESSFKFTVLKDEWSESDEGTVRSIQQFGRLLDVSPVTYPAYPDATVAQRSLEEWKQSNSYKPQTVKRLQLYRKDLECKNDDGFSGA